MIKHFRLLFISFTLLTVTALGACSQVQRTAFGTAETQELRAYRIMAIYTGLATLAKNDGLKTLDDIAYQKVLRVVKFKELSSPAFEKSMSKAATSLRVYAVGASFDIPLQLDMLSIAIKIAVADTRIVKQSLTIRRKINALNNAGRDPTPDEWEDLQSEALSIHQFIQGDGGN